MCLRRVFTGFIAMALLLPSLSRAQEANAEVWRSFAQRLDTGSEVVVHLHNGQRFRATMIDARPDALVLQPRTRRPVPVQLVAYEAILSLERNPSHGMGGGKAAAIGIAAGVGAFFAILGIVAATID